ncbi:hypothetical protein [Kitasatospora sp. NBC_00458]|uniref:hypothetical protein n=1 Tax=Kitasatospora sp. NBC_00458 TaxID=2903568 RepID=UPI002E178F20
MTVNNRSTGKRIFREARSWATSTVVVATEVVGRFTGPHTTADEITSYIHIGSIAALGVQLVIMAGRRGYRALNLRGSVNLAWGAAGPDSDGQ